jgi:hypothetical protein
MSSSMGKDDIPWKKWQKKFETTNQMVIGSNPWSDRNCYNNWFLSIFGQIGIALRYLLSPILVDVSLWESDGDLWGWRLL